MIQTDIADIDKPDASVDTGVFCLSLMGVNFPEFLSEANRLLKPGAILYIAEVLNRFTDVEAFINHVKKYSGFELVKKTKIGDYKTNVQETAPTAFYVMKF